MGDPRQPARPAARLRAAVATISRRATCRRCCRASCRDDWKGGFVLLVMIFVLSSFLDNIAAALIGGTMARTRVPRQGAHRLPGGDRRRVERRRLGQRGRRHHDDHDVDRRRRIRSTCWRPIVAAGGGAGRSAASRRRCSSSAIRRSSRTRSSDVRVDWARVGDRRCSSWSAAIVDQRGRSTCDIPEHCGRFPVHRRGGLGRDAR